MRTLDPPTIDADVPAALDLVLDGLLRKRLTEARAVEATYAADLARRVIAFTAGGRRRRSQLLWWSMRAVGGGQEEAYAALRTAAAMELIQTCALIHDDVMDGSRLRRGEPALHVALALQYRTGGRDGAEARFGKSAAVLAGDLALTWADDVFTEALLRTPHSAALGAEWRAMRNEMVAGQYLDLHTQVTGSRSSRRAMRTAVLKTAGYSSAHPLVLGALLAGAPERTARGLRRAGLCAGIAFQLQNDLQGAFGSPEHTGKPFGEDLREGKATYLLAVGHARCVRRGDTAGLKLLETVVGRPSATDAELRRVLDLLVAHGARAHVTARVAELAARAVGALRQADLAAEPTERLVRLLLDAVGLPLAGAAGPEQDGDDARRAGPALRQREAVTGGVR
ncbi:MULTISPECIES: polyprenyl synthetase family protein [Streptomyces]|uniref:polyprenyl synthetase family protein n=1 Tax=Streptomyces TaxID=1883 RepID=UPI00068EF8F5|nr:MULTISPECIES: polyprenyl synthetase family protein [Streptomyces]